ncbi:hypothetical protein D3C71_2030230 [compost metagenome]
MLLDERPHIDTPRIQTLHPTLEDRLLQKFTIPLQQLSFLNQLCIMGDFLTKLPDHFNQYFFADRLQQIVLGAKSYSFLRIGKRRVC